MSKKVKNSVYIGIGVALLLISGAYVYLDSIDYHVGEKGYHVVDDQPMWETSGDFRLIEQD